MSPLASVLIPIHNKPSTLPLTVDTVLRQTVEDLEVLLIGDGVTDDVRRVVETLVAADPRVGFLDFPKGPHHGEAYRHDAVLAARSEAIFYLCDDDLLLPEHVADLLDLLRTHNFVQSFNGWFRPDDTLGFYAADLASRATVELNLSDEIRYSSVSITGSAHTRAFYLAVDDRWETTPAGQWPDHYQWRKLMRHPDYSGATSTRMTALQFPTSGDGRDRWSDEERLAELARWHALVTAPDSQQRVDDIVTSSARTELARFREQVALLEHHLEGTRRAVEAVRFDLGEELAEAHAQVARQHEAALELSGQLDLAQARERRLRRRLRRTRRRARRAERTLDDLRASASWRATRPLRALSRWRGSSPR